MVVLYVSVPGATTSSVHGRRFHGVDSPSPGNTLDRQEIAAVLAEPLQTRYGEDGSFIGQYSSQQRRLDQPLQTRYGEDGSFIGQYSSRQRRLDQPILEELDETSGDRASDDTSDYACTTTGI